MKRCRDKGLIPQCVSINHPMQNEGARRILEIASDKLLRNEIKNIRRNLAYVDEDFTKLKEKLNSALDQDTMAKLTQMVTLQ